MEEPILIISYKFTKNDHVDLMEFKMSELKEYDNDVKNNQIVLVFKEPRRDVSLLGYFNMFHEGYVIPKERIIKCDIELSK